MQARFFESTFDNKEDDQIKEAIKALNELVDHYQKIEESNGSKLIIMLQTPWDRYKRWGSHVGIGGSLSLEPFPQKHPLLDSLQVMGFQLDTFLLIDNDKFRGMFSVFDAKLIAKIPEECHKVIKGEASALTLNKN